MKKTINLLYIFLLASTVFWSSCSTTELNPAYVYVPEVKVNTNSNEGVNTHKVTTVWAFVGNQPLGVFELPALIPVLKEGQEELVLQAGINNNGVSADRVIYPFYNEVRFTIDFQPLETDTIIPTFEYSDGANFAFISDFDTFGNFFEPFVACTWS